MQEGLVPAPKDMYESGPTLPHTLKRHGVGIITLPP